MKKILILLLILAPLFVGAQSWFTADAVSVGSGNSDGEWYECYVRVFSDKDGNVKIYAPDNTLVYRRIGDNYTKDEDSEGMSIAWKCVDEEGQRCSLSFNSYEGMLWLMIEYNNYTVLYQIIPDN